ncbi:tetratricopeptide repeat protein [Reichenbachiella sp. MSK19-1]|uniref:ATP-binding protein n=1 Tax=Reichenbachiella sp. MSK19-1 TaxID=1897631 RepID=UPI000E6C8DE4|nr:tetratricopeptide repeat protein [Reichenbachiella sp. MSK19-1]
MRWNIYIGLVASMMFSFNSLGHSIDVMIERADSCARLTDYDCAVSQYEEVLSYHDDVSGTVFVQINNKIADLLYKQGDFQKAYTTYQTALRRAEEDSMMHEKATALEGMSHILWRYGDNVKSIHSAMKSIGIYKALIDTASLISSSHILAGIYVSIGELDKAEDIYQSTLHMAKASYDSVGLASCYEYIGIVRFFEERYEQAIRFYMKSLSMNLQIGNELDAGVTYANIGEVYNYLESYDKALTYFEKSEEILQAHQFNSGLIFVHYSAGVSYTQLGEYEQAMDHFQKSLDLVRFTHETREKPEILRLIADCYAKQGKYEQAYQYHERYAEIDDSLAQVNRNLELLDVMGRYDLEEKEKRNEVLTQENVLRGRELADKETIIVQQYLFGAVLMALLLVAFVLAYKLYRNKELLAEADRTKNKLFGFVAHDLKAPVANIQMLVDMLQDELEEDSKEAHGLVVDINNASHSVSMLLNDLLSWSIAQQRGFAFNPKSVQLKGAVEHCVDLFNNQLAYKSLKVDNQVQEDVLVWMDENALLAIIRNLISNAVKFSSAGGCITMAGAVSDQSGHVLFSIQDDGVGMTPEQLNKILFMSTFTTQRGTANEKGSGMGLNLVKEFVEKSNGELNIASQVEVGTKITIVLKAGE